MFIHIYNFFTCFFFMGIEGQPEGLWYVFEIFFEVVMMFELSMQFLLRTRCKWLFADMHMLHTSSINNGLTKMQMARYVIVAVPITTIMSLSLTHDRQMYESFGISCIRLIKLLRFNEV